MFRNNDYEPSCLRDPQYNLAKKKTDLSYQKWSFILMDVSSDQNSIIMNYLFPWKYVYEVKMHNN